MIAFIDGNCRPIGRESRALGGFIGRAEERYGDMPVLIDGDRLLESGPLSGQREIDLALDRARVNWMGTDGMRGITLKDPESDVSGCAAFEALRRGVLSAAAVEYAAAACVKLLGRNGLHEIGDEVCAAGDGRDRAANGRYADAMIRGFLSAGARVKDLGILPTPFVPHCALSLGMRCGAMLTASHNPADQNGIKFFVNGKKLLPEGPIGEYALSALMWAEALAAEGEGSGIKPKKAASTAAFLDWTAKAKKFLDNAVNAHEISALREMSSAVPLVIDTANGAYHRLALEWLEGTGIRTLCVNPEPDGSNINRSCGVARLEGIACFGRPEEAREAPAAAALFRLGRESKADAWALALDGDGDRGFALRYDAGSDRVEVLDGDREGLAILAAAPFRGEGPRPWAAFTIESDIMAQAAAERAGYRVATVGVGDRWLSSFAPEGDAGTLAIGIESSGHLILPAPVDLGPDRPPALLLSGNGLVTALRALAAERNRHEPYESGFSRTWQVRKVCKARFRRGAPIWREDIAETERALEALGSDARLAFRRDDMADSDLLFWSIREGGRLAATLFARNSGTEDKHSVYLKCRRDLAPVLLPIAERLAARHVKILKKETE